MGLNMLKDIQKHLLSLIEPQSTQCFLSEISQSRPQWSVKNTFAGLIDFLSKDIFMSASKESPESKSSYFLCCWFLLRLINYLGTKAKESFLFLSFFRQLKGKPGRQANRQTRSIYFNLRRFITKICF